MKKKFVAMSLLALTLTTVGCSHTSSTSNNMETQKSSPSQASAEQKSHITNKLDFKTLFPSEEIRSYAQKMIGTKAPDFTLKNIKGEEVQLSKMKGQNTIIEIASSHCSACIHSFPAVESFKKLSQGQVNVVSIFPNDKKEDMENFFTTNKFERDETVIAGEGMNSLIKDYQVQYTPTFLFVDKQGYIQYVHVGGDADDALFSSMSDLAFKTTLSKSLNKVETVPSDAQKNAPAQEKK